MKKGTVIGMDLGDKTHEVCVVDGEGSVIQRATVTNSRESIEKFFALYRGVLVAIETGTHSAWISRALEALGCRVLVGNARKLRMIWDTANKNDVRDAEMLARIARFDETLLCPVRHRGADAQRDLGMVKARDALVRARADLINHLRGSVKAMGWRLPKCGADAFANKARLSLPGELHPTLTPVLEMVEALTKQIRVYDKKVGDLIEHSYPEAKRLIQVAGVGPLTSLGFVLSLEESNRFAKSRVVGAYLGLTPRRDQSGATDKQLRITKQGDKYMRQLLVGCAHYILGPFGPPSDLRSFGERLMQRGGKNAKRRAVVAVARKLAVLLHRLWVTGAVYDPDYKRNQQRLAA